MSIRDYNKKLNLVVQDAVTNEYKNYPIDKDFTSSTIWAIIENLAQDNIDNRIGFKVDFLIVS